jgi:predicted acyltransferase
LTAITAAEPTLPALPVTSKPGRITSLDWIRGLFLCWSITSIAWLDPRPDFMRHAKWIGVHPEDMIFPLFVTLSGCGLAFAYRNRVGWKATVRRSAVLLLCGLAFNAVEGGSADPSVLKWTGPLQVYAVLVLVVGLLHLVARGPVAWALIATAAAVGDEVLLYVWQQGCPGLVLTPECNPSLTIDTAWLGTAHMYHQGLSGHDPEGAVSMLGALVVISLGCTAGHLMLRTRGSRLGPLYVLAWAGLAFAGAVLAAQLVPAFKRLWTAPFDLGIGAIGVAGLAVGMALLDVPAGPRWNVARRRLASPWVAMGRNSLLLYFGSHLLVIVLLAHGGDPSLAEQAADAVTVHGWPQASFIVVNVLGWAALAWLLHWRRIYLRP